MLKDCAGSRNNEARRDSACDGPNASARQAALVRETLPDKRVILSLIRGTSTCNGMCCKYD